MGTVFSAVAEFFEKSWSTLKTAWNSFKDSLRKLLDSFYDLIATLKGAAKKAYEKLHDFIFGRGGPPDDLHQLGDMFINMGQQFQRQ